MSNALADSTVLLSFRLLPLFVVAPIEVFRRLPLLARLVLTVALALVLALAAPLPVDPPNWATVAWEFTLGVALAFGLHVAVGVAHMFGHVLDQQVGLAAAVIFDPSTDQASSLIAETLQLAVVVGFIAVGGHHALLRALAELTAAVPPGAPFRLSVGMFAQLGMLFGIGLALVAPIMLLMWLIDFALALVSRAAPQANVYFVSIPLKVGIALLALAWLSGRVLPVLYRLFAVALESWSATVRLP